MEIYKDNTIQNIDAMHETFRKVKEQLEQRVGQVTQFSQRIDAMGEKVGIVANRIDELKGTTNEEMIA